MKKLQTKTKVGIIALSALLAVGIVVGALAFFSTSFQVTNTFKVSAADAKFVEEFDAPKENEIIYGKEYRKVGKVINTGNAAVIARAKIEAEWKPATGSIAPNNQIETAGVDGAVADKFAATLDFKNNANTTGFAFHNTGSSASGKWVYNTANNYFVYQDEIQPGTESDELLGSVHFEGSLGDIASSTKKYYAKAAYDAWVAGGSIAVDEPTSYVTQQAAVTASADGKVVYVEKSTLKYPDFENATLEIKITGEIQQADQPWN